MSTVFISYRRDDSLDVTDRLYERLTAHFGVNTVFRDMDNIPLGVDFREHLADAVSQCDVLLAIIGDRWLDCDATGQRRLNHSNDFVRIEIESALARGIPVIPVLVGRAAMPAEADLPASLRPLAYRNAAEVRSGRDFHNHVNRLIQGVQRLIEHGSKRPQDRLQEPEELVRALRQCHEEKIVVPKAPDPAPDSYGTLVPDAPPPRSSIDVREYVVGALAIELVPVPAGSFQAGCTAEEAHDVLHNLAITNKSDVTRMLMSNRREQRQTGAFEISQHVITNHQYSLFVAATGHRWPTHWGGPRPPAGIADRPVVQVAIEDARAFCDWANLNLPTGNEWEKAARGVDGLRYPWGEVFSTALCHCAERGATETIRAEGYPEGDGPFGLRQATGNVWEWVDTPGEVPAVRGGSFNSTCQLYGALFTSLRAQAGVRRDDIGFRVVRRQSVPTPGPAAAAPRSSTSAVQRDLFDDLVEIPAGRFKKGLDRSLLAEIIDRFKLSESDVSTLVGPGVSTVSVPEFSIARRCVTNAQFLEFVRATGHKSPQGWELGISQGRATQDPRWLSLPVAGVSYFDADAFCQWAGVRLPCGDEWEYAGRGDDGRLYPWGDHFDADRCNSAETDRGGLLPVDDLPQGCSRFGLYHITGNVCEWVETRRGDAGGVRGGSYQQSCSVYGLVGFQLWAEREMAHEAFGFRVAR